MKIWISLGKKYFIINLNNLLAVFRYELDSLDEPMRPKTDRWTSNICKIKMTEKIDYSEFDFDKDYIETESMTSFKTNKTMNKSVNKTNLSIRSKMTTKKFTTRESKNPTPRHDENSDIEEIEVSEKKCKILTFSR